MIVAPPQFALPKFYAVVVGPTMENFSLPSKHLMVQTKESKASTIMDGCCYVAPNVCMLPNL